MSMYLQDLPVGSLVKDTSTVYNGEAIVWQVLEHNHDGYGLTTLLTKDVITFKPFDAKEPNNSDADRQNYGNNRDSKSNLLQWLNSDARAGEWYEAQHSADQAPSSAYVEANPYDAEAGFLTNFSSGFKSSLKKVSKHTALNAVTDGNSSEYYQTKLFLLSLTEVGFSSETGVYEGSIYKFFQDNNVDANRIKYPTNGAVNASTFKSSYISSEQGCGWRLRSPLMSTSYRTYNVGGSGGGDTFEVYRGDWCGVAPACVIVSAVKVSDIPGADGCYVLDFGGSIQNQERASGFKFLKDLPVGSLVKDPLTKYKGETIVWQILEHGHDGYGTTTLNTKNTLSHKVFNAKEPNNEDNLIQRYGHWRYSQSSLLQWLNADSNNWFIPVSETSVAPDYNDETGFLSNFSENFKNNLQTVGKSTKFDQELDITNNKIFLLAGSEVGFGSDHTEGTIYEYYKNASKQKTYSEVSLREMQQLLDSYGYDGTEEDYPHENDGDYYWLRSYAHNYINEGTTIFSFLTVNDNGEEGHTYAEASAGVAPACVIPFSIMVSDRPDSDGCYVLQFKDNTQSLINMNRLASYTNFVIPSLINAILPLTQSLQNFPIVAINANDQSEFDDIDDSDILLILETLVINNMASLSELEDVYINDFATSDDITVEKGSYDSVNHKFVS